MDTTNYDTEMERLRNEEIKKSKVGRPKGPEKVVFKRNVEPQLVAQLDAWIKGDHKPREALVMTGVAVSFVKEVDDLKGQLRGLLDDNEKLTTLVAGLETKIQRVARLTDNEKLILWIRKYDELKKAYDLKVGGSEFSQ